MPRSAEDLGRAGEKAALKFIKSHGYKPLVRNFSARGGEVDIIALDGDTICFVEVRTRSSNSFASPEATVDRRKQARIRSAASTYLAKHRMQNRRCRFDLVAILADSDAKAEWQIELIRGAF